MSETDHVGIILLLRLVSKKRGDPNFIKTSTMTKTANLPSGTPTNTNEGNEANNHTHGEVPVEQRADSAKIHDRDSSGSSSNNVLSVVPLTIIHPP